MSKTLLNIRLIITLFPNLAPNLLGAFPLRRAGPGLRALGRPAYVAGATSPGVRDTVDDTLGEDLSILRGSRNMQNS